jgi:S1-C subfamily serine protease
VHVRRRPALTLLVAAGLAGCGRPSSSEPAVRAEPVIFGADDRVEVYEVTEPALEEAVRRAVPAMVRASVLRVDDATGAVTFASRPLGPSHGLCAGEAHFDQPSAASCSATLIDDDLVLTAGHCVDGWACADQRFVFGWYYDAAGELHARSTSDVYACAEVVVTEYTRSNDYAIVRLDRAPPGPPMEVRATPVVVGEPVSLAGYPFGIPMKVVEGGAITATLSRSRFYARLDAQPGNSGSGVFDAELRVLGDLTNGPVEALTRDGDCSRLAVIGEDGWQTELISSIVPALEALCARGRGSERLCGALSVDAGPASADASVSLDAGLVRPDAALVRPDAARADAGPDAGVADPEPRLATHCGCATEATRAPGRPGALALWLLLGALSLRRGRRSGSAAST